MNTSKDQHVFYFPHMIKHFLQVKNKLSPVTHIQLNIYLWDSW